MIFLDQFLRPPWVLGSEIPGTSARMVAHLLNATGPAFEEVSTFYTTFAIDGEAIVTRDMRTGSTVGAMKITGGNWIHEAHRGLGLGARQIASLYRLVGPDRWVIPPRGPGKVHVFTKAGMGAYRRAWHLLSEAGNA